MKAFIEILSGIIRVGPDCDHYGSPYEYSVAFSSTDGKTAILKGLVIEDHHSGREHLRAVERELEKLHLVPSWGRLRSPE